MSNQVNHQRPAKKNNKRQNERPQPAMSCADHGHNGKLGRAKWVKLSRRNERRNAKQGREATIRKFKKETFEVKEHQTMFAGVAFTDRKVRKVRVAKPSAVERVEKDFEDFEF